MYAHSKERLEYLATIEDGWLDEYGSGKTISKEILTRTADLLDLFQSNNIKEPMLFPTEEGFILVEWHREDGITTIDVEPETYYFFNLDTNNVDNRYTHEENVTNVDKIIKFTLETVGTK